MCMTAEFIPLVTPYIIARRPSGVQGRPSAGIRVHPCPVIPAARKAPAQVRKPEIGQAVATPSGTDGVEKRGIVEFAKGGTVAG